MQVMLAVVLLALTSLASPGNAHAQWEVTTEDLPDRVRDGGVAVVRNDSGDSLKIYLGADDSVKGVFTLGEGLQALAEGSCPTYRVDEGGPERIGVNGSRCEVTPKQVRFKLGERDGSTIHSEPVRQLMNGSSIVLMYRLDRTGYRATRFSLARSKSVLRRVIGSDIDLGSE